MLTNLKSKKIKTFEVGIGYNIESSTLIGDSVGNVGGFS